ncbi:hypothetical protein [Vibrio mediterranei]|uniref:hypothetical protein n=1 Tax=Vibrio mediterranei TaxID=689 RepID=UPI002284CF22|nr:hypothetical protein [Vibrio mediterranei]MCY9852060.1 hypothetical protein [Vibrio mediterranei]
MSKRVAIYWPGEFYEKPNKLAQPEAEAALVQLQRAFEKLGWEPYVIEGCIDRPHKAQEKLWNIKDPVVGLFVHFAWGTHTLEGVIGKDTPLLLCSNFNRKWPGLVGLLSTSASLKSFDHDHSRIWTDAEDWSSDELFMSRLSEWCTTGQIQYDDSEIKRVMPISSESVDIAKSVSEEIRRKRITMLMLGDTSQGMVNSYFGPRLLMKHGFSEYKFDQSWIAHRGQFVTQERIEEAFKFVVEKGVKFHWEDDFTPESTKEQLRDYLTVLDMVNEYKADCLGWQHQIGMLEVLPPSDFAEGLLNSACRPESNGQSIVCATEADQGNAMPAELLKRLLEKKGLHGAVFMHDLRWCGEHENKDIWMMCNSGSSGAYGFNKQVDSLEGVNSYRQVRRKFPIGGGTFAGLGQPGEITWARCYNINDKLIMDIGRGNIVDLPEEKRNEWWNGATPEWPLLPTDLGVSKETIMGHYMSNHIAICYGDVMQEMVALSTELGFEVRIFGNN